MNKKYRVAWRSKYTGYAGHGDWMEKELAEAWCLRASKDWDGEVEHWVEESVLENTK